MVNLATSNVSNISSEAGELNRFSEAPPGIALRNNVIFFEEKLLTLPIPINTPPNTVCEEGTLANARANKRDRRSIFFCTNTIQAALNSSPLSESDLATVRAILVAHEIGHRLGLFHYSEYANSSGINAPQDIGNLSSNEYAIDSADPTILYLKQPLVLVGGYAQQTTNPNWGVDFLLARLPYKDPLTNRNVNYYFAPGTINQVPTGTTEVIWAYKADGPLGSNPTPVKSEVWVNTYRKFIMDWTYLFDPTRLMLSGWNFSSGANERDDLAILSANNLL